MVSSGLLRRVALVLYVFPHPLLLHTLSVFGHSGGYGASFVFTYPIGNLRSVFLSFFLQLLKFWIPALRCAHSLHQHFAEDIELHCANKQTPESLDSRGSIRTERPPFIGEVAAYFCG
jgi:hypothetical protein